MNKDNESRAIRERLAHARERRTSGLRRMTGRIASIAAVAAVAGAAWHGSGHVREFPRRAPAVLEATPAPGPRPEAPRAGAAATDARNTAEAGIHDAPAAQDARLGEAPRGNGGIDATPKPPSGTKREIPDTAEKAENRPRLASRAAKDADADGDAETARTHIERAPEEHRPDSAEAKSRQVRSATPPDVPAERRKAADAGAAGDLDAERAALERIRTRDRHLADAERAVVRDDWRGALRAFERAAAADPRDGRAAQGRDMAARIVAARRAVDDFLARPHRLSDPSVAAAARRTLDGLAVPAALSPRLETRGGDLERAIEAMRTPVRVLVLSDDNTDIGIRGVGRLGRVRERVVELRPGTHVFEGRRRGYRSKLVEATVAGGTSLAKVRIVCDERI